MCAPDLLKDAEYAMDLRLALYGKGAGDGEVQAYFDAVERRPRAGLHAEAALSTWLIWDSGLVAEPPQAYLRISDAVLETHGRHPEPGRNTRPQHHQ